MLVLAAGLLVGTLAGSLTGCVRPTYVNIPSQRGDLASNNPNTTNIRVLMAEAIRAAIDYEQYEQPFVVVLPEGSDQLTYERVVNRIGGGAVTPDTRVNDPLAAAHVVAVRVRNRDAEVDVHRPSPTGREAATVYLRWYYGGEWGVERVRPWRATLDEPLPTFSPPGLESADADTDAADSEPPAAESLYADDVEDGEAE